MRQIKRFFCLALALALLCAMPLAPRAQGPNLTTANVSNYPVLNFHGGFHELYINENYEECVFDPAWIGGLAAARLDDLLEKMKSLDINGATDILKEVMWEWFGPIQMDGKGVSKNEDITGNQNNWNPEYRTPSFDTDWRLSPIENAEKLHRYLEDVCDNYGVEKFNLRPISGTIPIVLAYLDEHGYDRVASLHIDITTHNGSTIFGELFARRMVVDVEALSKLEKIDGIVSFDLTALSSVLRWLFEPGVLSVVERFLKLAATRLIDRVYDEVVIPLLSTIPGLWTFVPAKDFETAKRVLLGRNPDADLVAKLNAWQDIALRADDILREAAGQVKVGVWAGYGTPLAPLGNSKGTNSDFMVDTKYASLGATCAPLDLPFLPGYRQKNTKCGHSHISPDRMIDASTCLLPEQTWFALNKQHGSELSYSGWHDWFLVTDKPNVHGNERYPQFMEAVQCYDSGYDEENDWHWEWRWYEYYPLEKSEGDTLLLVMKTIGLHLLKIWRWLLLLPLFWVSWL